MRVLVMGATGTIGRQLVAQSLEQGHAVTALARNPEKLDMSHANLEVVTGDVLDPSSLARVVPGHDAVMCAIGAGGKGVIREKGTRNIIEAMNKAGVDRLICLSSLGVGDSHGNLNFFYKYIMFGLFLRRAFQDHVAQEQLIRESGLQWTIVRPGAFTDGPLTGAYRHGFSSDAKGLKLKVSRADVAHFMLNQLKDLQYMAGTPGLSY